MFIFPAEQPPVQVPPPRPSRIYTEAEKEAAFQQAQDLFYSWTGLIHDQLRDALLPHQQMLRERQVQLDPESETPFPVEVQAKGMDVADWRMDLYFDAERAYGRPVDASWKRTVEEEILAILQPLQDLFAVLGVNEYLFEGLNEHEDGLTLPIEPYEDSELCKQLRRLLPDEMRAAEDEDEED